LYDLSGTKIRVLTDVDNGTSEPLLVDMTGLSSGIYIVEITGVNGNQEYYRVIKN